MKVSFGTKALSYPAFLASGMIGFNIMNSTLISGIIIWNDRRHGMFEQIMSGPFTRSNYILSNITTIAIVGLVSAALIAAVGYPVFFQSAEFSSSYNSTDCFQLNSWRNIIWFYCFNHFRKTAFK